MVSVFSENLRVYNAIHFKQSLIDPDAHNIYLTYGRVTPWANDLAPPQANSSVTSFNDIWQNMVGAKLISGNDVRHAIPRNDWAANTNYAAYDHCTCSLLMFQPNVKFFIVTSDWNVYKCLANNNGGLSSVMPTQIQTTTAVEESDGYIWKYMYTLSAEERIRFMTDEYIPVQTLTLDNNSLQWRVQEDAVDGAIEAIKVTNGGTNYSNSSNIIITITGDGSGANAIARTNAAQSITNILITDKGQDYTYADVSITGGGGVNAAARVMISPSGGHGSDPMRELGGSYLILNPRVRSSEDGKLPVKNELRQIALIQDPKLKATGNVATGRVYSQVLTVTVSSGSDDYQLDETVYQGGSLATSTFNGTVVNWDSGNNQLKLANTIGTPISAALTGNTSTTSRVIDSVTDKDLLDQSGYLLYIDYIQPITRSIDQTEDYKIVLKF